MDKQKINSKPKRFGSSQSLNANGDTNPDLKHLPQYMTDLEKFSKFGKGMVE